MNYLHPNDLIVYRTNNNELHSAGFGINSILLKNGLTQSSNEHLAVPFGLYLKPYESQMDEHCNQECHGPITEEIHNTFIALVGVSEPVVKQTKHKKKERKSSTKKNKPKNRLNK